MANRVKFVLAGALLLLPALSGCSSSNDGSSKDDDDVRTLFVTGWTNQNDYRVSALLSAIGPPNAEGKDVYQGHVQIDMQAWESTEDYRAIPCHKDMVRVDVQIAGGGVEKKESFSDIPCGVGTDLFTNLQLTIEPDYNITLDWN